MSKEEEPAPARPRKFAPLQVAPYLAGLMVLGCRPDLAAWSPSLDAIALWTGWALCAVSSAAMALDIALRPRPQMDDDGMGGLLQASHAVMAGLIFWRMGTYIMEKTPVWTGHLIAALAFVGLAAYVRACRRPARAPLPEAHLLERKIP